MKKARPRGRALIDDEDGALGGSLGELLDALLHGADGVVRDLAGEGAEVLGLRDAGLQAAAPVLGADVESLDRRLGRQEVTPRGEAGVGIFLGDLEQLQAGLGGAIARLDELAVHLGRSGLRGLADLLKALGGLAHADLGELADALVGGLGGLSGMLDHVVERGAGGHGTGPWLGCTWKTVARWPAVYGTSIVRCNINCCAARRKVKN